ncbi:MAG: ArsR/SmtB family transcription factor [Candidatus Hadarchaeales archaeon]
MMKQAYKLFFKTLANEARLAILFSLKMGPKCVMEICEDTGLEQSRVSHNLKCLTNCGFVSVERRGKNRIYSLNKATIVPLLKLIDHHIANYRDHMIKCEVLRE